MRLFSSFATIAAFAGVTLTGGLPQASATMAVEIRPNITVTGFDFNDPRYLTFVGTGFDGVGAVLITNSTGDFLCTGSLLETGIHLLTAAHCLTDASGNINVLSASAIFFPSPSGTETLNVVGITVHPDFNGTLENGADLAVLTLSSEASAGVQRYGLYRNSDEVGQTFDIAGFGRSGNGTLGDFVDAGTRLHGLNQFDATATGTFDVFGWTGGEHLLFSDFDDGTAEHDAFGYFFGLNGLGLGLDEVNPAPSDSGSPAFVNGQVAAVNSFAIRVFFDNGNTSDVDGVLNASFGEFSSYTRVSAYQGWVDEQLVPEPATWATMLAGVGVLLGLARRRRPRL